MNQIIIQIAKYLIILLMAMYAFQCFAVFRFANEYDRKGIYFRQIFFMVLINFFGFLSLYSHYGELKYFRAYLIEQLGIIIIIAIYRFVYPTANRLIINNMCMLITVGLIILTRLSYSRAMKQFAIVMGTIVITLIVPFLISRITFFEKFKWMYAALGIGALLLVLVFSTVTYGSKLNITIASYTFQPSEFVKIVFVFAISSILATGKELKDVIISALIAGAHIIILVASKDLGSAIIFFVIYLSILFVATRNYFYLVVGLISAVFGSMLGYRLFSHVRIRVLAFKDPFTYIDDAGYQIAQSLFAIGTGGWLGMGVAQGAPNTIPVVAQDFIFSAICEEFGVIFGMCVILVCVSNFIMFMNIAMRFKDKFFKLVAVGLASAYGFQVILTVGGVIKFIPMTGVTLPLVSYGGTSVAVTCLVFAVIQGLYISRGRDVAKIKLDEYKLKNAKTSIVELDDADANNETVTRIRRKNRKKDLSNTQVMDDVLKKVVSEGIEFSNTPELENIDIKDI